VQVQGSRGLLAHYYSWGSVSNWEVLETLEQDYAAEPPFPASEGWGRDEWSVTLTGYLYAPVAAEYQLTMTADDQFNLWINKGAFSLQEDSAINPGAPAAGADWQAVINEPCVAVECPERAVTGTVMLAAGWYEIYAYYYDVSNQASWKIEWATTDNAIVAGVIPASNLRSGAGPTVIEAWVYPYDVDGDHTIVSQSVVSGFAGWSLGIHKGGVSASVYTGCDCSNEVAVKCDEYREIQSWKAAVRANTWQHIAAQYDGSSWTLKVDGVLLDTKSFPDVPSKYFPESLSPILFGRESFTDGVPIGAPSEIRQFYGLIYQFTKWGFPVETSTGCPDMQQFAPDAMLADVTPAATLLRRLVTPLCHLGTETILRAAAAGSVNVNVTLGRNVTRAELQAVCATGKHLQLFLQLNEGIGLRATTTTSNEPTDAMYADAIITAPPAGNDLWVWAAGCPAWETFRAVTEVYGTALEQAIVGKCAVFTIESRDKCSHKRYRGGDAYKVVIVGPLHLHSDQQILTVGDGIVDHADGSYTVTFERTIAGYYSIKVLLEDDVCLNDSFGDDGCKVDEYTTYMHAYIHDAENSYLFDDADDLLSLNELKQTMAGLEVSVMLQSVDMFGNLRTAGGLHQHIAAYITGPYTFDGVVADMDDGTGRYLITYKPEVPGRYQMAVRMGATAEPVCAYGESTCGGNWLHGFDSCNLQEAPAADTELCRHCIDVLPGASFKFEAGGMPVIFPDTDALDLQSPFTMYAFVQKAAPSGAAKEYVMSKMSEASGKGYYLALTPTGAPGEYTVESGLYVGAEEFRVLSADMTFAEGQWVSLAVTYDGRTQRLSADGVLAAEMVYATTRQVRPNAKELKVGKGFAGLIDDVLILGEVRDNTMTTDTMCPMVGPMAGPAPVLAYYRANEAEGVVTMDSSPQRNDGVLGLLCKTAAETQTLTLTCATGYNITDILYANYGENDGTCGAYSVGACAATTSMQVVTDACVGENTCSILVAAVDFGATCVTTTPTLAVNAVCKHTTMSGWPTDAATTPIPASMVAPTHVGVTMVNAAELFCPLPLLGQGIGFAGSVPALPLAARTALAAMQATAQCGGVEMLGMATAGVPVVFALQAKDACGYRAVSEDYEFVGTVTYPDAENVADHSAPGDCPAVLLNAPTQINVTMHNNTAHCGTYADMHVMSYVPTADGPAHLAVSLRTVGEVDVPLFTPIEVAVAYGVISAVATTVTGAATLGGEAGVATRMLVTAKDVMGNRVPEWGAAPSIHVALTDGPVLDFVVLDDPTAPGLYTIAVTFPAAGTFTLEVTLAGDALFAGSVTVTGAMVRAVDQLTYAFPEARFEHSMVSFEDDLYIFGGAKADKTYLDSLLKFDLAMEADTLFWNYKRQVRLSLSLSHCVALAGSSPSPSLPHRVTFRNPPPSPCLLPRLPGDCCGPSGEGVQRGAVRRHRGTHRRG
jgi:hypothetical protein